MGLYTTHLDPSKCECRILKVLPGKIDDPIRCEMEVFSLLETPEYHALSYCWGNESHRKRIFVNNQEVFVTTNLIGALQWYRANASSNSTLIWVDAICINQIYDFEKGNQVRLMHQIYNKAARTYAWIGSDGLEDIAPDIRPLSSFLVITTGKISSSSSSSLPGRETGTMLQSLAHICALPYWQRCWIVQELIMSSNVYVVYAGDIVKLTEFEILLRSLACVETDNHEVNAICAFARTTLDLRANYRRRRLSLLSTLRKTFTFQSSDSRDRIFALRGICADGPSLVPLPNYRQPTGTVSRNFTRSILRQTKNLDIILIAQNTSNDMDLPSWSVDWLSPRLAACTIDAANKFIDPERCFEVEAWFNGSVKELVAQGVLIGSVQEMTSPFNSVCLLSADEMPNVLDCTGTDDDVSVQQYRTDTQYYNGKSALILAVHECFLDVEPASHVKTEFFLTSYQSGVTLKIVTALSKLWAVPDNLPIPLWRTALMFKRYLGLARQVSSSPDLDAKIGSEYRTWLSTNKRFMIQDISLETALIDAWAYVPLFWLLGATGLLASIVVVAKVSFATKPDLHLPKIFPAWGSEKNRLGAVIVLGVFVGILSLPLVSICIWYVARIMKATLNAESIRKRLRKRFRIVKLDTGAIASSFSGDVRSGDVVCFLAGCSRAAVLRPHASDKYEVIGACHVSLNRQDRRSYNVFRRFENASELAAARERLIEQGLWRDFILV